MVPIPLPLLLGEGSEKEPWPLQALLSGRKLPPSSHSDDGQFSSSSDVSDAPFNLLPLCWSSEGVSLSKFVCGPFKRSHLRLQQLLSQIALVHTGFYSQKLWGLIFLALESWALGPHEGLEPLAPEISLWVWDQLFCIPNPPTSLNVVSSLILLLFSSLIP